MRTKDVGYSVDLSRMVYTVHLFDSKNREFMKVEERIPHVRDLADLAAGVVTKFIELSEEIVEVPRDLFRDVLKEVRGFLN